VERRRAGRAAARAVGDAAPALDPPRRHPSLSPQLNGVTYTLAASEATLKNSRSLTGAWVSASTRVGDGVTGTVGYDLGARAATAAAVAARVIGGVPMDLGARWAEAGNAWTLDAAARPAKGHKAFAALNPATGAARGSYAVDIGDGVTLGAAHAFDKNATSLSAAKAVAGGRALASLSLPDRVGVLQFSKGALRAGVKAKLLPGGGVGRPSVSLSVDRALSFDPFPAPAPPPPPPRKANPLLDNALFRRLHEVDAARLGRSVKGVAVETFSRPKAA
jgi:hypothetical protein